MYVFTHIKYAEDMLSFYGLRVLGPNNTNRWTLSSCLTCILFSFPKIGEPSYLHSHLGKTVLFLPLEIQVLLSLQLGNQDLVLFPYHWLFKFSLLTIGELCSLSLPLGNQVLFPYHCGIKFTFPTIGYIFLLPFGSLFPTIQELLFSSLI